MSEKYEAQATPVFQRKTPAYHVEESKSSVVDARLRGVLHAQQAVALFLKAWVGVRLGLRKQGSAKIFGFN